jgi:UDP-glucuronate decarboxylase
MKEVGACSAGMIERPLAEGYTRFEIHDKNLRAWLRASVGTNAKNKHIPRQFLQLSTGQSQSLLLALFEGDAHHVNEGGRNSYTYTTTSCQLADDVQELSLRCGWRATIGNDGRGSFYVSVVPNKNFASLSRHSEKEIPFAERVAYAGKVYSLSVPNRTLITRRNGRVAVHSSANAGS